MRSALRIKELLIAKPDEQTIAVQGWVRSFRNNQFIALNDGSTNNNLQVVIALNGLPPETLSRITTGAAIRATGHLAASLGKGQSV